MPAQLGGRFGTLRHSVNRNVMLLALTSLCADISTEMMYPVLPVFLTTVLRAPATIVGLIEGIAEGIQYGVQGFAGSLADRLTRKKPVAIVGYALAALGKPIIGVAPAWPAALLGRGVDRLGAGSRSAPRDALIAGSVDKAHQGLAFGLEGVGDNAGAFLGPLVALLLVLMLHLPLRLIFLLAFFPGLLALVLILLVREAPAAHIPGTHLAGTQTSSPAPAPPRLSLRTATPTYRRYLAITALFGIGNSTNAFLILRLQGIDSSFALTLLVYAGFNLVAALISAPAGAIADQLGRKPVLFGCLLVFVLVYIGFALGAAPALLALLFIGYGIFQGTYRTVGKAYAADLVPAALRASGIGWYATVIGLTGFAASSIGGWLWAHVAPTTTFFYGAACALLALLALALLMPAPGAGQSGLST